MTSSLGGGSEHDGARQSLVVVTGAKGGIGRAIVARLIAGGSTVAAIDHPSTHPESASALECGHDGPVYWFGCDVTNPDAVIVTVETIERRLGPIDHLVNCAGVLHVADVVAMTITDWDAMLAVNCTAVFMLSKSVVQRMIPRGSGSVVTIGSNAANLGRVEMSGYAASKAAASAFTRCLGLEVARHGIRCNVVAPGTTATGMISALWGGTDAETGSIDGSLERFRPGIPLGRIAQPADIAEAVEFLLSDRAAHITMQELTVDGGAALGI